MGTPQKQLPQRSHDLEVQDPEDAELVTPIALPAGGLDALTRGEIDVQVSTAHRYPRNVTRSRSNALSMATVDDEIAGGCFYHLEKAGKPIEGPSVRLAEIFASTWGNLRFGARIIDEGDKFITAQGFCHDLETNVAVGIEVVRRITDKRGRRYNDDMIQTTAAAAQSIALRNAIFRVVPRVYVDHVFREARKVAVGDATTLVARREKTLEWFGKAGVTPERMLARLGRNGVEEINLEDLGTLRGLATSIRDSLITVDAAFPPVAVAEKPGEHAGTKAAAAAADVAAVAQKARAARKPAEEKHDDEPPAQDDGSQRLADEMG